MTIAIRTCTISEIFTILIIHFFLTITRTMIPLSLNGITGLFSKFSIAKNWSFESGNLVLFSTKYLMIYRKY